MKIDAALGIQEPEFRVGPGGEAFHWYAPGPPVACAYEIKGKNGNWRPTTLRDARLYGLVPSVSTISRLEAQPSLSRWVGRQMALAALTHPRASEIKDTDELLTMIEKDSQEQAKAAAARGTEIHAAVEHWIEYGTFEEWSTPYVVAVAEALHRLTGVDDRSKWRTEVAAVHPFGYGGRIDLVSEELGWVTDMKSKDFGPDDKVKAYPNQCRELSAYRKLVCPSARTANIFISRTHPGLVRVVEHNDADAARGWAEFVCLLRFWQIRNGLEVKAGEV